MPDLLTVDERGAAAATVLRYVAMFNPVVLSAAFGPATFAGNDSHCRKDQFFVLSDTTIYYVNWEGVYKSVDSGATFSLAAGQTFAGPSPSDDGRQSNTGMHLAFDNGTNTLYLCGVRLNSSNLLVGWRMNLATEVLEETIHAGAIGTPYVIGDAYLFNNVLYFSAGNGTSSQFKRSYDPIAKGFANFTLAVTMAASKKYAVLNDGNLYCLAHRSSGNFFDIWRFTGSWDNLANVAVTTTTVANQKDESRPGFFTDPITGDAVAIMNWDSGVNIGWAVTRIPAPYDMVGATQVQTTVLAGHLSLLNATDGGTASDFGDKRCLVIIDTETTPGTTRIYLAFTESSSVGTPFSFYEWQGFGAPITFIGAGGQVHNGVGTPTNGGARFFTPGQLTVRMAPPVRDAATGGQRLHFVGFGGGNHTVRFRRARNGQDADGAPAKLIGPVTGGGSLGTNEVTGHPFDGTTVGTVVWDLTNDTPAFAVGETNIIIVPEWSV